MKIGICSIYGNPLHQGHCEYLQAAKDRSDVLCVIVNNDKQVELKGSKRFMDEDHRLAIIRALRCVDLSMISIDKDSSVAESIRVLFESSIAFSKRHRFWGFINRIFYGKDEFTFFNSGDRDPENFNKKENKVCEELGIYTEFIDLPKIYSSSELIK